MKTKSKLKQITLAALLTLPLTAFATSIEGTYTLVSGPVKDVTLTLGKQLYVFSTGGNGQYEVSEGKVLFTGSSFKDVLKIEGDDLVSKNWKFTRQK